MTIKVHGPLVLLFLLSIQIGIKEDDVGVIAPYRKQVTLIRDLLTCIQGVEVNTVDQYQGRDKDIIIISLTRSFLSSRNADTKVRVYTMKTLHRYCKSIISVTAVVRWDAVLVFCFQSIHFSIEFSRSRMVMSIPNEENVQCLVWFLILLRANIYQIAMQHYDYIISFFFQSGELLKDVRRLNVALTRAKKMLIMVGHVSSMKSYPPLQAVINILKENDNVSFFYYAWDWWTSIKHCEIVFMHGGQILWIVNIIDCCIGM